jgi:hypothetical protein
MILRRAANIFLYCIDQMVSVTEKQHVSCEVEIELLNIHHHWQKDPVGDLAFL